MVDQVLVIIEIWISNSKSIDNEWDLMDREVVDFVSLLASLENVNSVVGQGWELFGCIFILNHDLWRSSGWCHSWIWNIKVPLKI